MDNRENIRPRRIVNELGEYRIEKFKNITLILTDKCNLNCTYCYEHNNTNCSKKTMTNEVAKKALDMFYEQVDERANYTSISLFGGEPHMAFDTIKFVVDYTKRHRTIGGYKGNRFNYSLNTNGTILTKDIFSLYSELGKKINVRLSIDGYKENHDVTRKTIDGKGSWKLLERNLKDYMRLRDEFGVLLTAVTTINQSNCKDIFYNFTKIYELTGISYIGALFVHEQDWKDEEFEIILQQVDKLYDYCQKHKMIFPICQIRPEKLDDVHICSSGLTSYVVDYKGDIYPCHRIYFYDVGEFYKMGDIYKGISPSKNMLMYDINNMKNLPNKCNQCHSTTRAKCHICFATNTVAYKDPFKVSQKYCMFQKQLHYMLVNKWREKQKREVIDGGSNNGKYND